MTLINIVSAGTTKYCNEILKNAPFLAIAPAQVEAGLLVVFDSLKEFALATENSSIDGVTVVGSRDTAVGIWNIAYTCNCDAITVLTDDTSIAGTEVFVGLNGRATTTVPAVESYIVGKVRSEIKTTTLCDGTVSNCYDVELCDCSMKFTPPILVKKKS